MIRKLAKVAVGVPIDAHRRIVAPRLFDQDKQAASEGKLEHFSEWRRWDDCDVCQCNINGG